MINPNTADDRKIGGGLFARVFLLPRMHSSGGCGVTVRSASVKLLARKRSFLPLFGANRLRLFSQQAAGVRGDGNEAGAECAAGPDPSRNSTGADGPAARRRSGWCGGCGGYGGGGRSPDAGASTGASPAGYGPAACSYGGDHRTYAAGAGRGPANPADRSPVGARAASAGASAAAIRGSGSVPDAGAGSSTQGCCDSDESSDPGCARSSGIRCSAGSEVKGGRRPADP